MELSSWFVCAIGLGTVFAGLICLILICRLVGLFAADRPMQKPPAAVRPTESGAETVIENRGAVVAAIAAAAAEELGEEVSHIRIVSIARKSGPDFDG